MRKISKALLIGSALLSMNGLAFAAPKQMENLTRGLVASNVGKGMLVSWRLLGTDDPATEFNLYRDGDKIASIKGTEGTNYLDKDGKASSKYQVSAVIGGKEGAKAGLSVVLDKTVANTGNSFPYKTIKLEVPAKQTMPDGSTCTYTPNDMSAADLDGDGELELILKWDPSNAHDNSQSGYTGTVFIDAYKLDGTRMWRIDLGKNIRAGAHYTQFQVYDYDGDGKAEMIVKTADGTIDGTGKAIGDKSKDYRNSGGTVLDGPEYLTVFRGADGAAITSIDFVPSRNINQHVKGVDKKGYWGDNYGNRCERYIAATAYLDGIHPSAIFIRGYYSSSYVVAYDFDGKTLKQRWYHKSEDPGAGLYAQGNHNIVTGDIDGDGYDEIVFGGAALNHDGTLRYSTQLGHGDAGHLSDLDPDLPGLEFFDVHEHTDAKYTDEVRGPDGKIIWGTPQPNPGVDNGRGMAADIDSTHRGFEVWSSKSGGMHDIKGKSMGSPAVSTNFRIYFDGDLQDELLDGAYVTKFNSSAGKSEVYFDGPTALGATGCNGTKNTPSLVADLFGDWREELVVRNANDPTVLYIVSTPVTSPYRVYTLMHDAVYRTAIAWQNTAYNQPPHLGYYLPDAVKKLAAPEIQIVGDPIVSVPDPTEDYPVIKDGKSSMEICKPVEGKGFACETNNAGYEQDGFYNFDNSMGSYGVWEIFSPQDVKTTLTIRFANGGTANRNMTLYINDKSAGTVEFAATGWTTYKDVTVNVALKAGKNTLKLVSASSDGGPNVDTFTFGMDGIELYNNQKLPELGKDTIPDGISIAGVPGVNAYNPNTGVLRSNRSGSAQVVVYDMRGHVVGSVYTHVNEGLNMVVIDREMLPQGKYFVKVDVDGVMVSKGTFLNK
ncbi:carbohydrate-binding protein [Fibrobacter sp. UWEL]|uniref:rhamnogalacturonan lyase family protein n=1 Tax=Fibrobacter sp. UWEL TaxID=1896209 RepID=UPI000910DC1A|nr:carbohydrate-binding protein [Fibrobacter sp. UWEL]SHK49220.1 Por secretion system C-terminal sorting domain-containing protein [Fibrobacter sp. UWEL]